MQKAPQGTYSAAAGKRMERWVHHKITKLLQQDKTQVSMCVLHFGAALDVPHAGLRQDLGHTHLAHVLEHVMVICYYCCIRA